MKTLVKLALALGMVVVYAATPQAETPWKEMLGSNLIEGYNYGKDVGPKGRIRYDADKNRFRGGYKGLKTQKGQKAIFAWVHDTAAQKSEYIGPVGVLNKKGKANFVIDVPDKFKDGNWGSFEIIGFTAHPTESLGKKKKVVNKPAEPSGTKSVPKPAFYMFAALPGAKTERHFCGHGQDFFFANAPEKQICYDCICGQKYSVCIKAGLG